ncbi:GDP-fucose protein O-fucosyltransferase protein [Dioscorea alata]|uniref:GDP-fucose protein O-fucosyltransferase protein n=1 Tax=Dioscorea alata TaxID=55571 RepID=A0ACB7VYH8_DIOAL|nr:GDP-fucose protein O-fucosyltransferase protein [Dioscorea alata]
MERRRLSLRLMRRVITVAAAAIAVGALLAVHVFRSSEVPKLREIGYLGWSGELQWTQELAPPQLSKQQDKLLGKSEIVEFEKLWKSPSRRNFVQCVAPSSSYMHPVESRGYLLVHTNGGLNQMRAGICDMVAVARLINATLVVPELDKRSFWQDSSNFSDVFDEEYFIESLANDVKIVKKLPKEFATATKAVKQFISWSGVEYYQGEIARLWDDYQVIRAAKSDSRLANNNLPADIQKLRCRAFYNSLRFSPRIEALAQLLVERMRSFGPYIALHLRYEKDMLAFSGCTYGLSPAEADELTQIRENTSYWKVKDIDSQEQRVKGYCPLTPKEVGILLSALGYPSNTPIYVAAGEIYGGDSQMADLRSRFPTLISKENLASSEELEPFSHYASQMAALDYIVSVQSDVFIPSYSGNMARAVAGHRRYLGHRKTINPDRKELVHLFNKLDRGSLNEGRKLSETIIELHKRRQGSPRKRKGPISGTRGKERFRSEEAFYENPLPDCLCQEESKFIHRS